MGRATEGSVYEEIIERDAAGKPLRTRWVGAIDLGRGPDGKRRRKKVVGQGKTTRQQKADAGRRLRKLQQQLEEGMDVSTSPTVAQVAERWLRAAPGDPSPKTVQSREWAVRKHIVPALGHVRVDRLTPDAVEDWLGAVAAGGASKSTVNRLRVTLRQVLAEAVRRRQVTWNVADVIHVPKAPDNVQGRQALDPDEAAALLAVADEHRLGAWLTVTMLLGLRPGETSGLRWGDVDLEERTLRVGAQLRWDGPRAELVAPKTARSTRTLRLDERTMRALHRHRKAQAEERLRVGRHWPEQWRELVFLSEAGTPLEPKNLRRAMASISRSAGLPRAVRPYELRHTAATIASHAGVRIEDLADQLGHTTTRMLERHYRHAPRVIDAAAGAVSGALGRGEQRATSGES